ncbi:MAG: hypothetical protein C5B55_06615 [Blastocatellia bacterium]|nr:MAG: hypothetical protein C5B55_06615 [Blastocatellia bacterium]
MFGEDYNPNSRRRIIFYYTLSLCAVIVLMDVFSSWRTRPLEETITVDANRTKPVAIAPIQTPTELPTADRDIETAGDRIAAAVIYLKRKQNEPALNALEQASAATQRALARNPDKGVIREQLQATNQQLETVKDLIRSGRIGTATIALKEVDQKLEAVSY